MVYGYPGCRANTNLANERFVWRGMQKDFCQWGDIYNQFQKAKVKRLAAAPLGQPVFITGGLSMFSHRPRRFCQPLQ